MMHCLPMLHDCLYIFVLAGKHPMHFGESLSESMSCNVMPIYYHCNFLYYGMAAA
jgi:hypothetical protein